MILPENDPAPDMSEAIARGISLLNGHPESNEAGEGDSVTLPESAAVAKALYGKLAGPIEAVDLTGNWRRWSRTAS